MKTDNHKPYTDRLLSFFAVAGACWVLLAGCSKGEEPEDLQLPEEGVRVELVLPDIPSKAIGDPTYAVNRLLLIPFKKIDETGADVASNFAPVYASAKQIDVRALTAHVLIPDLNPASTYRMLAIGYEKADYNFNPSAPEGVSNRFSIGAATAPVTLANFHLKTVSPVDVPEFFTVVCTAHGKGDVAIGQSFKPATVKKLRGTLTRLVSGISVTINDIPTFVKSIQLSAEQLVIASTAAPVIPADTAGRPTVWQTVGDAGTKILGTAVPAARIVKFEKLILPTFNVRKTRLMLKVSYGSTSETYTVKVPDKAGVSSTNYLMFRTNQAIRITGSYNNINLGFTISSTVNLDDNAWDGL